MSSIEEKIVSMKFDNKNFTREIDNAIKSLENFKKSLKMDDATQGFDKISKSAKDANKNLKMDGADKGLKALGKTAKETAKEVQMDGADKGLKAIDKAAQSTAKSVRMDGADKGLKDIATAAENVKMDEVGNAAEGAKSKFSALEIAGIACMVNIANKALETGKQILSAFTIDPIMDGFREYETQMNSVQTILANTKSKGTTIKDVNGALSELNTYADKTIYNFTEMTRNIGTFTAAGVDLEKSTKAIKGIANLAAVSGSSSAQASNAMYQLSQALASGRVTLEDWNSVVNAGMGGEVFQKALQRTAKVMGKTIDESESFRESISAKKGSESWLTSDVLIETLNEFTGDMTEAELASKGYNEQQIKEIMDMADTAQQAATRVKTFTQLIDTLKEAVGSGWTQTWQYIFGDFEEAREMWTDISNFLSDGINAYSDARNNMLGDWYELGGRTELLEGLKNVALSLVDVFKAVGGAFSEIFPQTTGQQLYDLTVKFKEFTSNFKMSTENLDKLKAAFKGFFSLIDIGKEFVLAFGKGLLTALGGTGTILENVLNLAAGLGNFITALRDSIKQGDLFGKMFTSLGGIFKLVLTQLGYFADNIRIVFNEIGKFVSEKLNINGFDVINTVISILTSGFDKLIEYTLKAEKVLSDFLGGKGFNGINIGDKLSNIFDTIYKIFGESEEEVEESTDKMTFDVTSMVNNIGNVLKNISFASIGLAVAGTIRKIGNKLSEKGFLSDFFDGLKKNIDKVTSTVTGKIDQITSIFDDVRESIKLYQKDLKANILLKIAGAIGILAGSIMIVSKIDQSKLAGSLASIGGLFAELLVATKIYSMIGEFKASAVKATTLLIGMSTSVLILGSALKKISDIDILSLTSSLIAISGMIAALTLSVKSLSKGGEFVKGSIGIIAFAAAIKILASAVKDMSDIPFQELAASVAGLMGVMLSLSLFLNKTNFSKLGIKSATSLVIIGASLKTFASACKDFGTMNWEQIAKGLTGMGGVLTELALYSNLMKNTKNLINMATSMVIIGTAMNIMYPTLANIGSLNWEQIAKGLTGMGGVLLEISLYSNLTKNCSNYVKMGVSLTIIAGAMNIMYYALSNIGHLDWSQIAKGLTGMGGVLLEISLYSNFTSNCSNYVKMGVSLTVMAGAMNVMYYALANIGNLDWSQITKGLAGMGGALAELSVFNKLMSNASGLIKSAAYVGLMAVSLQQLTIPFQTIGKMDWNSITKSVVGVGLALTEIGLALKCMPKDTPIFAFKLIEVATALNIIGKAMGEIGNLSWEQIGKGLVGISGSLMAIAAALHFMPEDTIFTALGLTGVATAMVTLSKAFNTIGDLSWGDVAKGIISLATGIGILAGGIKLMEGSIGGVLALTLACASLNLLVPPIMQLSAISWDGLVKSIVGLGGAIAVFGVSAALLQPVIPAMLALGGSLVLLGASVIGVGLALSLAGEGIALLANAFFQLEGASTESCQSVTQALTAILQGLAGGIPIIIEAIGQGVVQALQVLIDSVPKFGEFVRVCVEQLCITFTSTIPNLFSAIIQSLDQILTTLVQWGPSLFAKGAEILLQLLTTLSSKMPEFTNVAVNICVSFINGISSKMSDIVNAAFNLIISFINGLADAVNNHNGELISAAGNLIKAFINAIKNFASEAMSAGGYIVEGFVNGIRGAISKAANAAAELGRAAINAAKNALDINSPSKEFETLGMWSDYGLAEGFTGYSGTVTSASENVALSALDAMRQGIAGIGDILTEGVEEPSITPVVDLSQIQNGAKTINDLMNFDSFGIQGTVDQTVNTSRSLNRIVTPDNSENIKQTTETNIPEGGAKPAVLQLVLQNGQAIAEYIIDDIDSLMGKKSKIQGRKLGYV